MASRLVGWLVDYCMCKNYINPISLRGKVTCATGQT